MNRDHLSASPPPSPTPAVSSSFYSPGREKVSCASRCPVSFAARRALQFLLRPRKVVILFASCFLFALFVFSQLVGSKLDSSVRDSSRGGYTVLINTWKRYSLLKKTVHHYASCSYVSSIRVVWSESDPPTEDLTLYLLKTVSQQSRNSQKPSFRFDINKEDSLNNRFKPIKGLENDAIFSVDDDVVIPCSTLDFAFSVWQTAPDAMVGFVPRMHWPEEKNGFTSYKYGNWWSVWWTGTYSMVLTKAALFHRKYLDIYTNKMPSSIRDYVTRERNCEDIAMSLLIANATGASPIWVKGKVYEIGSVGISSLKSHNEKRNKCLNEFISIYGKSPLVSTNMKAVDTRQEWFW